MSLIKKYPLPVYDPPASYRDFSGGINTGLSNESLQPNELRDALNCHYKNGTLMNRPGASRITKLEGLPKERPQGDFIFSTKNVSWIISVRNGRIYYGDFNSEESSNMRLLHTNIIIPENDIDPENYIVNLQILTEGEDDIEKAFSQPHQGFIYKHYAMFGEAEDSDEPINPEDIEYTHTLVIQNTKRVQAIPVDDYFIMATGTRILKIYEVQNGDYFYLESEILKAFAPNSWEFSTIGPNYLSPFPQQHVSESMGVPMTSIGQILVDKIILDVKNPEESWTFKPLISTAVGEDKTDFYYKWEIGYASYADPERTRQTGFTGWKTVWFWDAEKNPDKKTSKGKSNFTITPSEVEKLFKKDDDTNISFTDEEGNFIDTYPAILVRVSITDKFQTTTNINTNETTIVRDTIEGENDFVALQATSSVYSRTHRTFPLYYGHDFSIHDVDQYFYYIHSCTKVTADGQKALFYDDAYNTGSWFKTVISKYNYITKNMSLSFKTTKNESLVAVAVFDTNIIAFADNEQLGGNISVVTGNGDDYKKDDYYSPYQRKVVNTSVSCDSFNSMQQVDNYVVFKYRKDIYTLDSTALSNLDTVTVETINDNVRSQFNGIEMPLDRVRSLRNGEDYEWDFHKVYKCLKPDEIFSEVYEGCYSIIFPRQGNFIDTLNVPSDRLTILYGGPTAAFQGKYMENVSIKPGLRWKCYIRNGRLYQNTSKPSYPWLRDVSYLFDIVSIIHVEGQPCYIRENGDVIRFDKDNAVSYLADSGFINDDPTNTYADESYKLKIITKAYDMEAPALCKFLDSCTLYYNRDFTNIANMKIQIHNEADYELYGPDNEAFISITSLTDQVKYGDNLSFDDALNLMDKDKPMTQYEDYPYIDPIDKPTLILNDYKGVRDNTGNYVSPALNRPKYTSRTCTPKWRFPFLSCCVSIELEGNQAFTLSALNFSYTSSDMPDYTREQLYRNIIRNDYLR